MYQKLANDENNNFYNNKKKKINHKTVKTLNC